MRSVVPAAGYLLLARHSRSPSCAVSAGRSGQDRGDEKSGQGRQGCGAGQQRGRRFDISPSPLGGGQMIEALTDMAIACRAPWWVCPQRTGPPRVTAIAAAAMTPPGQLARLRDVLMVSSQLGSGCPGTGRLTSRAATACPRALECR